MHYASRRTETVPNRLLLIEQRLTQRYGPTTSPKVPIELPPDVIPGPESRTRAFTVDDGSPIRLESMPTSRKQMLRLSPRAGSAQSHELSGSAPAFKPDNDGRTYPRSDNAVQVKVSGTQTGNDDSIPDSDSSKITTPEVPGDSPEVQPPQTAANNADWGKLDEKMQEQEQEQERALPADDGFLANLKTLIGDAKLRAASGQETPSVSPVETANTPRQGPATVVAGKDAADGPSGVDDDSFGQETSRPNNTGQNPEPSRYAVFDNFGKQLQRAARFDAGTVPVDKTFAAIEASLDAQVARDAAHAQRLTAKSKSDAPPLTTIDRVEDMALMRQAEGTASGLHNSTPVEAYMLSSNIPLDPGIGGRSINVSELRTGDLVVSTTREVPSRIIRVATDSPISHAMLYVGDDLVVEAISEGVSLTTIDKAISESNLVVAFRHPDLSPDQALRIRDYAGSQIGKKYNWIGLVRQAGFKLDQKTFCSDKSGSDFDHCTRWVGKVNLGTATNDRFYCSELVLKAYQDAGLPLTTLPPNYSNPGDIPELQQRGTLSYIGHIKYEP